MFLRSVLFSLFVLSSISAFSQHPTGYASVRQWTNYATFTVDGSARKVVEDKKVTFEVHRESELSFSCLVDADGSVKYVRFPRCGSDETELKRGGTDALYAFRFNPLPAGTPEEWVRVIMRITPEGLTPLAQ